MDHTPHPPREAALLIRPLPKALVTGDEPIRFGGRPRLPEHLDWPRFANGEPAHFVAEIDLARLPRSPDMPAFPETGTVFIFLPLTDGGEARVLYTAESGADLPERSPPEDLWDLRSDLTWMVDDDGTTDDGKLLVRQVAEALPFISQRAINPLALNMLEAAGEFVSPWKQAHRTHEQELERVFREARPFPPAPKHVDWLTEEAERIPYAVRKTNFSGFEPHFLDWEFIFDWARGFYLECCDLTLQHYREMHEAGNRQYLLRYFSYRVQKKRRRIRTRRFGKGRRPLFWTFDEPCAVDRQFDWQASRWMALSQFETGMAPGHMVARFVDMLIEIERNYRDTDQEGDRLPTRIGLLDNSVKGHDKHARHTLRCADMAFRRASKKAKARLGTAFERLPQAERWARRVMDSAYQPDHSPHRFSLGTMPIQMFGLGFEIQQAVTDHADDVLLFQIGDSFGLPLQIGPDGVLQLWISPEDLAAGRFDRVEMTMDAT